MKKEEVDLIIHHAKIYTVDEKFSTAEAFAIKGGKFVAIGDNKSILGKYISIKIIDMKGKAVYPGFIDAHCHFLGYGLFKNRVDLTGSKSFEEVLKRIEQFAKSNPNGWIIGRGWDQNIWEIKEFPDNAKLNKLFPDRPVLLTRVDGHAVLVNDKAFQKSEIDEEKFKDYIIYKNGKSTGILLDNAADLAKEAASNPTTEDIAQALLLAQKDCFAVGLTTVNDAGLSVREVEIIDSLNKSGELKMRIYAMLNPGIETENFVITKGKYKTDQLNVRSIKLYADGALGSRGACLLESYSDDPDNFGKILENTEYYRKYCSLALNNGFQVCTHAIGDSANRLILMIYTEFLKKDLDLRWRIEHAQVVNENDFKLFSQYHIVPSVQPTHATSDMNWAAKRLGSERVKNAYAYKKLMLLNGWIPAGSDFPVEDINPLFGFYAAFERKDNDGEPENGFQMENALSREDALKAMTIWAARSNFEDSEKGSIETGKYADFVVLDRDILTVPSNQTFSAKVLSTFIGGKMVFGQN